MTRASLAVNVVTVMDGDSGTVNAMFTASLSTAFGSKVTVDWCDLRRDGVGVGGLHGRDRDADLRGRRLQDDVRRGGYR